MLDLIGAHSALDSLRLVADGGTVCVSGMLSGDWVIPAFEPVATIPSGRKLTAYHSDDLKGRAAVSVLGKVVHRVRSGVYQANVDRVFPLDEIVAAHQYMEDNRAVGKVVVRI